MVGGGGALGVTAGDTAEPYGFELPILPTDIQEQIMAILPKPGSSASNPIDAANPGVPPEILKEVLLKAGAFEKIDLADIDTVALYLQVFFPAEQYSTG